MKPGQFLIFRALCNQWRMGEEYSILKKRKKERERQREKESGRRLTIRRASSPEQEDNNQMTGNLWASPALNEEPSKAHFPSQGL